MDVNILMQYVSYLFIAIGMMAFIVSGITQVIKEWPGLEQIPTSMVVTITSLILCPVGLIAACQYLNMPITWYMVFASFIAAFIVALVAMGGWEKVNEIWERTKYKK